MKRVPCRYKDCGTRRRHWEDPYTERGTQYIEFPDDQEFPPYVYCSIECAILDGAISVNKDPGSTVIEP